jgi:excinuclease ABC subunit C
MKKEIFKKLKLPEKPGVYFFLKGKEILYIGKATSLKDRVKSYFGKDLIDTRGPIVLDMVFKADKIDWQTTDSVLEALILEANLIKKHQPKYNTKEKSDKSFNYVCITKEKLPKVLIIRGKNIKNEEYNKTYGPYPNGGQLKNALSIIRPIFPFLDNKSKNYYKFYKQVGLVPDILSDDGIKQYKKNITNLKLFFEGKKKKILKNLKKDMSDHAKKQAFENAGEIKKQIFSLNHINDVALLKAERTEENNRFRIEAYDIAHMGGKNMVGVMVVVEDGEVNKNEYRKFKIRTQNDANDTGALTEVLERRFGHTEWPYPNLVVVDGSIAQINATQKTLKKVEVRVPIVSVVKDEHHKPKAIMGDEKFGLKYKREILLANSEAHRFAIAYHKKIRNKNFLK